MGSKGATEMGVSAGSLALARVLSHPMRVAILISMNTPKRRLSPARFAREHGLDNNKAAYHFRTLASADCIELVDERQVRGATEHIYEPRTRALAWQAEWEALGPVVQQTLLAS